MKKISPQHPPSKKLSIKFKTIPNEKELYDFIKKSKKLLNFTLIAKHFGMHKITTRDLVYALVAKHKLRLEEIGNSIIVRVNEK